MSADRSISEPVRILRWVTWGWSKPRSDWKEGFPPPRPALERGRIWELASGRWHSLERKTLRIDTSGGMKYVLDLAFQVVMCDGKWMKGAFFVLWERLWVDAEVEYDEDDEEEDDQSGEILPASPRYEVFRNPLAACEASLQETSTDALTAAATDVGAFLLEQYFLALRQDRHGPDEWVISADAMLDIEAIKLRVWPELRWRAV